MIIIWSPWIYFKITMNRIWRNSLLKKKRGRLYSVNHSVYISTRVGILWVCRCRLYNLRNTTDTSRTYIYDLRDLYCWSGTTDLRYNDTYIYKPIRIGKVHVPILNTYLQLCKMCRIWTRKKENASAAQYTYTYIRIS